MELEPSSGAQPVPDGRPKIDLPLPVRMLCVEDALLPAQSGQERELDAFYVGMLGFERFSEPQAYRADNRVLRFALHEGLIQRGDYRRLCLEVENLRAVEQRFIDAEMEYTRELGVDAAHRALVLLDPAGNWLEITEQRLVS